MPTAWFRARWEEPASRIAAMILSFPTHFALLRMPISKAA